MTQMQPFMNPYMPQMPQQGYLPQMPQQGYAPQMPQQGYTPQVAAPGFDLNTWAKSQGVDVEQLGGPEAFLSSLMAGVDRASELEQHLQVMAQQQQQQQSPSQNDWRQFEAYMAKDDQGRVVPKPGMEHLVSVGALNAANEELQRQKQRIHSLLTKPQEFMQEQIGPYIQEQIAEGIRRQQEQAARDATIKSFMEQNASVIYQKDANGLLTDVPSERGQRLQQIAIELQQDGVAPERILERASQLFKMEMLEEQEQMRTQQEQMRHQISMLQQDPQRMQAAYQHLQQMGMAPSGYPQPQPQPQPQQQQQRYQPSEPKFPWQQPDPMAPPKQNQQMPWQVPQNQQMPWQPQPQPQPQPQQQMQSQPQQQMPWQAPRQQSFLQDNDLSSAGSNGAWNTNERHESPLTDDDVDADVESILNAALEQQGLG